MVSLKLLHDNIFNDPFFSPLFKSEETSEMKVDIVENEKEFILYADVPGVDKKDVELQISDEGVLMIEVKHKEDKKDRKFLRRERMIKQTKRSFAFEGIKSDEVEASLEKGVLEVKIPKVDLSIKKERNIEIK